MRLQDKKWHSIFKNINGMLPVLRTECITYLTAALNDNNGKEISLATYCETNNIDPDEFEEDEVDSVYITYDGGRHPEYNSTAFALLKAVKFNSKGNVVVELDEEEEYELDRVNTLELAEICYFVATCIGQEYD